MSVEIQQAPVEDQIFKMRPLLSWRCALAGVVVAALIVISLFSLLMGLGWIGLALGGAPLRSFSSDLVVALMLVISVLVGSYFSVRLARINAEAVGMSQGLLVGSIFILLVVSQIFLLAGTVGPWASPSLGPDGSSVFSNFRDPLAVTLIEDEIPDLNFNLEREVVINGLALRLFYGDQVQARNYLARQAEITLGESDQRIGRIQSQFDYLLEKNRLASDSAFRSLGWLFFNVVAFTALASVFGGYIATRRNENYTLDMKARSRTGKPSYFKAFSISRT
jgi:hypothetical protein